MKIKFLFIVIMIIISHRSMAQKSIVEILVEYNKKDSISNYSFNINNTGFNPDQSFILKKNEIIKTDYKCLLIKSDSIFSFWSVFENTYKYEIEENLCAHISFVLLFDKINKKLFYIEYNKHPVDDCPFRFNKNLDLEYAMPHFDSWITKIIELDNNFYPILGFYTSWKLGYAIGSIIEIKHTDNIWWGKTLDINKKYNETSYKYLIDISREDFKNTQPQKIKNDFLFPLYMSVDL